MLKRSKTFMRNRNSIIFSSLLVIVPVILFAANGVMPIDDKELKLLEGRKLLLKRAGVHSHTLLLMQNSNLVWKRTFEEEYDRLWDYAFFVPVKKGRYSVDINGDGNPEIAIATWDGGNNIAKRDALVFTVKKDSIKYLTRGKFNLEYGEYVFK